MAELMMILKGIGIIFVFLLLLILFVVLMILCSPFQYELEGKQKNQRDFISKGHMKWLCSAIQVYFSYDSKKSPLVQIKIFGKEWKKKEKKTSFEDLEKHRKEEAVLVAQEQTKQEQEEEKTKEQETKEIIVSLDLEKEEKPSYMEKVQPLGQQKEEANEQKQRYIRVSIEEIEEPAKEDIPKETKKPEMKEILSEVDWKEEWERIFSKEAIEEDMKIFKQIRKLYETYDEIEDKKGICEAVVLFLKKAMKGVMPKDFRLKGIVGFADPSLTGQFMGAMSLVTAKYGDHIQVSCDFTKATIRQTEIFVKGRMRVSYFVGIGIQLLKNKAIRNAVKTIQKGRK